jgi:hypothetical protein
MALLLALVSPTLAQQPAADPGLTPVPADAFVFVSVKVSKLWDNPAAKPFRDWVATQQKEGILESMVGLPFGDIDRVTVIVQSLESRAKSNDDEPVVLVTTRQKYTDANVLKALAGGVGDGKPLPLTGRAAKLRRDFGPFRTVLLANDRTLVFSTSNLDEQEAAAVLARLTARKGDGPLSAALTAANTHDIAASLNMTMLEPFAQLLAKEESAAPFLVLLKAKTVTLTADVDKTAKGKLVMAFADADTAKKAAKALEDGMRLITTELEREARRPGGDSIEKLIVVRVVDVLKNGKVSVDGSNAVVSAELAFADDIPKIVATLPKSLKSSIIETTTSNNLKQLGIAMHNFHDANGFLPGDVGPDNKAMSWRVLILPYVEQDNLYKQLDPNKPWNDPANLKALEEMEMPKVFEHPGRPAPKGHTYFRIFTLPAKAKGTDRPLFTENARGPRLTDIADGTANTFMIVEAAEAVPWYKPDVLAYDGKLPLPQLGGKDAEVFWVAFCDGSVRKIKTKLDEKTLRALITTRGNEVIPDLDK